VTGERHKHWSREEILLPLPACPVAGPTSLLFFFFDVAVMAALARLLTNPWIAEATVQKFYPNPIAWRFPFSERAAFVAVQKAGPSLAGHGERRHVL